ncbi:MAG: CoA pyrophosphatase [Candidatus Latescibacteria bacterium]|nr:CoA pyrophosphatase [Candidatus Latescibacterota bacterium]
MDLGVWAAVQVGLAKHQPLLVGSTDKTRAAVAVVLGPTPEGLQLLFIERAQHPDDPWSGHIAFPGGRIEADDPSPRAAAERETLEEVGLDLSTAEYWGRVDDLTGYMLPVVVSGFVYRLATPAALTLNHEIESAFWAGADQFRDPSKRTHYRLRRRGKEQAFPALDLLGPNRPLLWGLTFRIVRQLIAWMEPDKA